MEDMLAYALFIVYGSSQQQNAGLPFLSHSITCVYICIAYNGTWLPNTDISTVFVLLKWSLSSILLTIFGYFKIFLINKLGDGGDWQHWRQRHDSWATQLMFCAQICAIRRSRECCLSTGHYLHPLQKKKT